MPTAQEIVAFIGTHLAQNAERVVNIAIGPRREGWFNAEAFVAINTNANILSADSFAAYGEESIGTVFSKVGIRPSGDSEEGKIPDLVGYGINHGGHDVSFVIEAKVLYSIDQDDGAAVLTSLDQQVRRAKTFFPHAICIGIVYAVAVAGKGCAQPEPFFTRVSAAMMSALTEPTYAWCTNAVECVPNLHLRATTLPYPSSTLSLGLGGRYIT